MVKLEEIAQGGAFDTVEAVRELARVVVELARAVVELTARVAALETVSTKARSDAKVTKREGREGG